MNNDSRVLCPVCVEEGLKSRVNGSYVSTTSMGGDRSFWDEEGRPHTHIWNGSSQRFSCSNGHAWKLTTYPRCPTCGFQYAPNVVSDVIGRKERADG